MKLNTEIPLMMTRMIGMMNKWFGTVFARLFKKKKTLKEMIKIEDFFKENSFEINWDFVLTLPHFCEMDKTQQNPRWHMEGTAWGHTKEVCKHAYKFMTLEGEDKNLHQKRLFMLSALFHDVGKPKTTFMGKDGNWHSYGHENVGSKIVREMLWDWPIYDREYISHMVKWHMEPLFFRKAKNPKELVNKITKEVPWKDIYLLKMSDLEGAHQDPSCSTKEADRQTLEEFKEVGKELDNIPWISMLKFFPPRAHDHVNRWVGCSGDLPCYGSNEAKSDVNVMIGLPGSGKNTYIDFMLERIPEGTEVVVLSRDDLRVELGYCGPDEKIVGTDEQEKKVTEVFNRRFLEAVDAGKDVILNNINLSTKRRKAYKVLLGKRKVRWNYWYIEAPTLQDNLDRRKGQISESVFHNMIQNFDFPEPNEYKSLTVVKQKKS